MNDLYFIIFIFLYFVSCTSTCICYEIIIVIHIKVIILSGQLYLNCFKRETVCNIYLIEKNIKYKINNMRGSLNKNKLFFNSNMIHYPPQKKGALSNFHDLKKNFAFLKKLS
jgi:hypothetical protein